MNFRYYYCLLAYYIVVYLAMDSLPEQICTDGERTEVNVDHEVML